MKKLLLYIGVMLYTITGWAQQSKFQPFEGVIVNSEYKIYIKMNFYNNNIVVPNQELFGDLPGFLGDSIDLRKWLFTSAKIKKNIAKIAIINDYGSEDLIATLTLNKDSTYTLTQIEGSKLKIARNRKWQKLPKELVFVRKR